MKKTAAADAATQPGAAPLLPPILDDPEKRAVARIALTAVFVHGLLPTSIGRQPEDVVAQAEVYADAMLKRIP